jgi:hypothetical protein
MGEGNVQTTKAAVVQSCSVSPLGFLRENGIGAGEKTKAQALASGFDSEQKNT